MSARHSVCLSILASMISSGLPARAIASISYTVTDLGPVHASGINNSGQVVGKYTPAGAVDSHGFLWSNGHLTDLGLLGTGQAQNSVATAINDNGQIVGTANTDYVQRAFVWSNGQMSGVGSLGSDWGSAAAINSSGQIVGSSTLPFTSPGMYGAAHAYMSNNGQMNDLGTLGGVNSSATAINKLGEVAGTSETALNPHAFLYTNGNLIDVGTLSTSKYASSEAAGINDLGQVVGVSNAGPQGNVDHAFLYGAGKMIDLGTLGGSGSSAYAINNSGQIVGVSGYVGVNGSSAFIYANGAMTDLNSLIDPAFGDHLELATAINNNGQIVAIGDVDSYLLTPTGSMVPEPGELAAILAAGFGMLGRPAHFAHRDGGMS